MSEMDLSGYTWTDTNGDGVGDTAWADQNGDGAADAWAFDTTFDGSTDLMGWDTDGNGAADTVSLDSDGNGDLDSSGWDTDGNGLVNVVAGPATGGEAVTVTETATDTATDTQTYGETGYVGPATNPNPLLSPALLNDPYGFAAVNRILDTQAHMVDIWTAPENTVWEYEYRY